MYNTKTGRLANEPPFFVEGEEGKTELNAAPQGFIQTKLFFSTMRDSGPILNKRSTMLKLGRKPKRDWKT